MARYTAEGLSYPDAMKLIQVLRSQHIEANITAGGIALYPEPQQVPVAQNICKEAGAHFSAGFSSHQEDIMLQSDSGWTVVERVTNDAIAVQQEWRQ